MTKPNPKIIDIAERFSEFRLHAFPSTSNGGEGVSFMELGARMTGRDDTSERERSPSTCPSLYLFGLDLSANLPNEARQRLLPLALMIAETRSDKHVRGRMKILGEAACDIAEMVLHLYEDRHPDDGRVRAAIEAARAYWRSPSHEAAVAAWRAARFATNAADNASYHDSARSAADAAVAAANTAHAGGGFAKAADDTARENIARACGAYAAASTLAAARAAWAAGAGAWDDEDEAIEAANLAGAIFDRAISAFDEAINAGPHREPDPVADEERLAELAQHGR